MNDIEMGSFVPGEPSGDLQNVHKFCGNCGSPIKAGAKFCGNCGGKIEPLAESATKHIQRGGSAPNKYVNTDFGLIPTKPIHTRDREDQWRFVRSLETPDGKKLTWSYRDTVHIEGSDRPVDIYDAFLNGQAYQTIYLCNYGTNSEFSMVPEGFKKAESHITEPSKPERKGSLHYLLVGVIVALIVFLLVKFFAYQ